MTGHSPKVFEFDGMTFWRRFGDGSKMLVDAAEMLKYVNEAVEFEEAMEERWGHTGAITKRADRVPTEVKKEEEPDFHPLAPPDGEVPKFNLAKYSQVETSTSKH